METLINGIKMNVANQAARKLISGRSYILSYSREQLARKLGEALLDAAYEAKFENTT
ncbi:MAG TPA: hypothetical protein VMX17_15675 [Candidatus Glassbacteria bacterium]|nr:hypothetical protein [Candidatus Glassbacteria bacterium]